VWGILWGDTRAQSPLKRTQTETRLTPKQAVREGDGLRRTPWESRCSPFTKLGTIKTVAARDEELQVREAILDGEVVALDSQGRPNFRDLLAPTAAGALRDMLAEDEQE
jgi:hypothetical protein